MDKGRSWKEIVTQPTYLVALFGAVTGYGIMILAMTATPLAMAHHQHDLPNTATVIQLHVLGMFLPSFFTGSLIARFGVLRIMLTGIVLFAGHVTMSLTGTGFGSFAAAPPRGRLELPLHRRNDPPDEHLHPGRKGQGSSNQRHDDFHDRPRLFVQRGRTVAAPWMAEAQPSPGAMDGRRRPRTSLAGLEAAGS